MDDRVHVVVREDLRVRESIEDLVPADALDGVRLVRDGSEEDGGEGAFGNGRGDVPGVAVRAVLRGGRALLRDEKVDGASGRKRGRRPPSASGRLEIVRLVRVIIVYHDLGVEEPHVPGVVDGDEFEGHGHAARRFEVAVAAVDDDLPPEALPVERLVHRAAFAGEAFEDVEDAIQKQRRGLRVERPAPLHFPQESAYVRVVVHVRLPAPRR